MALDLVHLIILNAGILILLSVLAGRIVSLIKLPRVTGYLLVGILLGPSVLGYFYPSLGNYILNSKITDIYTIITEIGLGFIIFNVGGEFRFEHIKKLGSSVFKISLFEISLTFLLVFALVFLSVLIFYSPPQGQELSLPLTYGLLLGVVAIATAPAATLLVLREYESEGPITDNVLVLIGLNNIVCILLFKIMFSILVVSEGNIFEPFLEVFISIILGLGVGLLVSVGEKWLNEPLEILLLVIGGITLNIGLVSVFEDVLPNLYPELFTGINISNLLANLCMGIMLVNSSTEGDRSFKALKKAEMPVYVLFFVLAGANLHIEELFTGGILFVIYVIGRSLGKYFGPYIGLKYLGEYEKYKDNIGLAILPQAGVAIGLALILKSSGYSIGGILSSVILSGVIVFEIVGPIFTRLAIVRGGEVKEISLSKRSWTRNRRIYQRVFLKLKRSLGLKHTNKKERITCKSIMRSSFDILKVSASFDEVCDFATKSTYDQFMVIDDDGHFIGIISYNEIRDILLDDEFAKLIIAQDMVHEKTYVARPTNSIQELVNMFHVSETGEYLPVVDNDNPPHLIGIVTQKDTLNMYTKLDKKGHIE